MEQVALKAVVVCILFLEQNLIALHMKFAQNAKSWSKFSFFMHQFYLFKFEGTVAEMKGLFVHKVHKEKTNNCLILSAQKFVVPLGFGKILSTQKGQKYLDLCNTFRSPWDFFHQANSLCGKYRLNC